MPSCNDDAHRIDAVGLLGYIGVYSLGFRVEGVGYIGLTLG